IVMVTTRREVASVVVAVHNRGEIPAAIVDRFFDKYSTYGKTHGNGLGNYSAFLIARAHGGGIDAATSSTAGTTVTVVLPAAGESDANTPRDVAVHPAERPRAQIADATHVLVVDDEPHNRKVLGAMIRNFNIRVSEADNGRSALNFLATQTPDVV